MGSGINVFDILQSLKMVDDPVSVVLISGGNGEDRVGKIYMSGRKIYHVEYEDLNGPEALKYLLNTTIKKALIIRRDKPIPHSSMSVNVDDILLRLSFEKGDIGENTYRIEGLGNLLAKEEDVIAFFIVRVGEKAELVDIVYMKEVASPSKVNLAFRALEVVKRVEEAFTGCQFLVCKKGEFLYYVRGLGKGEYGVLISVEDAPIEVMKLIMDRLK